MIDRILIASRRTGLLFGLAVAMAFGLGLSASQARELSARPFTDLYIFGDSLSDSGNLFVASGGAAPPSPPYFGGRFSDGPVWVESLALLDVNAAFSQILDDPAIFGLDNVSAPCLIQMPDGSRDPTGLCPPTGDTFDSDGVLFWDLIHPSAAGHRTIAIVAHSTLQALQNRTVMARRVDDDDD